MLLVDGERGLAVALGLELGWTWRLIDNWRSGCHCVGLFVVLVCEIEGEGEFRCGVVAFLAGYVSSRDSRIGI